MKESENISFALFSRAVNLNVCFGCFLFGAFADAVVVAHLSLWVVSSLIENCLLIDDYREVSCDDVTAVVSFDH